ncbi:MAG: MFS transporter [Ferroplasma sp.]|uniref:MFS transporter n=1 Tax=Ferroplasma sp. TaxID=2591003 RepID=UPI00281626C4|nr:MFS transporter [Ferroplasma sp.]WMT50915.1 MAG: MFS transporter [Ferroplasma sp.]
MQNDTGNIRAKQLRHIMGASIFSFSMNSTLRFFIPVLIPLLVASLNISVYMASLFITSYWIGYTLFQIPSGIIADRMGVARVARLSFLLMALVFSFFYFVKNSYVEIIIIQFFLGCFSATVYVSDTSVIQKWIPATGRSTFVGIYQTGFFIGASLGEYFILRALDISFEFLYISIMLVLAIAAVMNFLFIKEPPVKERRKRTRIDKKILYVAMIRFSAGFLYIGFITLFTTFIVFDHIIPYSTAYLYAWIPAVGGIITSPFGGFISSKVKRGKSLVSIIPVIALGSIVIYINYAPVAAVFGISFLSGMLYGLYAGPSMGMASDFSGGDHNLASASSILNFSSQVGGTVSPLIIGYFFSLYGNFRLAFTFIALISIIIVLIPLIKIKF